MVILYSVILIVRLIKVQLNVGGLVVVLMEFLVESCLLCLGWQKVFIVKFFNDINGFFGCLISMIWFFIRVRFIVD